MRWLATGKMIALPIMLAPSATADRATGFVAQMQMYRPDHLGDLS